MQLSDPKIQNWLCPNLSDYWRLRHCRSRNDWILQGRLVSRRIRLTPEEGYALTHFSGTMTLHQIQHRCQKKFASISADFVLRLLNKLVDWGVLMNEKDVPESPTSHQTKQSISSDSIHLKTGVRWTHQQDGHWILGDVEGLHHLQVSPQDKAIIDQLGVMPLKQIAQQHCSSKHLRTLLNLLTQAQLLEGLEFLKSSRRKFTPLQLLYFKKTLVNPDQWLSRHVRKLDWVWQKFTGLCLGIFLMLSFIAMTAHRPDLILFGQQLLQTYSWNLVLPFGLLSMAVVSLHELAHAFTLKHFGGVVSEVGLLFMCLMPAAYTNSSDAYRLRTSQHCLVIGAGVLCQVTIAAVAFWLWFATAKSTWVHTTSYLLMIAALFTIALNLNPLARFDGYYLLSAAMGIRNLKPRSLALYSALLTQRPIPETGCDRCFLTIYGPFSILYLLLVFGKLFLWLGNLVLTHIPYLTLIVFVIWLVYYLYPAKS